MIAYHLQVTKGRRLMFKSPVDSRDGIPKVQSGALFPGTSNDTQIYLYGGVTPDGNTSFPEWQAPTTQNHTLYMPLFRVDGFFSFRQASSAD